MILALVAALLVALALPGAAAARDDVVTSFDGTPIVVHFFPATGLPAGERAPTVLYGAGWGVPSETDPSGGSVSNYVKAGYNVLTWDARGLYQSGATVMVDHRDFEARDVQALLDFVA